MGELEKYGLIAAAAALFFWPQIQSFLKSKAPTQEAKGSASGVVVSRTVGSDRGEWINDLLNLQKVLVANGQQKPADLLAQVMVLLVAAEDTKK